MNSSALEGQAPAEPIGGLPSRASFGILKGKGASQEVELMTKRVGVCVVGLGWMGRVHSEALASIPEEATLFVCSRSEEKSREFAQRYGAAGWFTDYEQVLKDERVHAVDLCLPHHLHGPYARQAFAAGKHVLVEKPMASTWEEAVGMVEEARRQGRLLAVAENMRTYPQCAEAQRRIQEGALGEVFFLQVNHFAFYTPQTEWRWALETAGGGALIDVGHHYVDLAVMLGGRVRRVFAHTHRKTNLRVEGEDTAILHLEHEEGATGHLVTSFGMPGSPLAPMFVVCGTEGSLAFEHRGRGLVLHRRGKEPEVLLPAQFPESHWEETIRRGVRAFVKGIGEGREEPLSAAGGLHDMAVIFAAYRSAQTGQPVAIGPQGPA